MKRIILFIGLFLSVSSHAECPKVSVQVSELIAEHVDSIRGGEYCHARQVLLAEDVEIVLYTIEGPCYKQEKSPPGSCGNHFFRSMVGIIDGKKYEKVIVGGKGVFLAETIRIEGGVVAIKGLSYSNSDPMCCPSVSSTRRYKLDNGSFVEVKP
ncbi:hypothetical protein [Teredinibacter purpureus]|uniref:hypothetical protein n=1 Tax=Teredinibacter purpureus TaxID=2731756 RepID=UPI0005F7A3F4|nr:hypothetical protein [Teredinibacter purpureus]